MLENLIFNMNAKKVDHFFRGLLYWKMNCRWWVWLFGGILYDTSSFIVPSAWCDKSVDLSIVRDRRFGPGRIADESITASETWNFFPQSWEPGRSIVILKPVGRGNTIAMMRVTRACTKIILYLEALGKSTDQVSLFRTYGIYLWAMSSTQIGTVQRACVTRA